MGPELQLMPQKQVRTLDLPPFRGKINAAFDLAGIRQTLSTWARTASVPNSEILHKGRNLVLAAKIPGISLENEEIVIKVFQPKGLKKIKTLVVPSNAAKAWKGAAALSDAGIGTALPIAYLESQKRGIFEQGCFVAGRIQEAREIRDLFRDLSNHEITSLLDQLVIYLRRCHGAGILHRDLSDGNILVKKDGQGRFLFFLIDTNRIRFRKKISALRAAKNLIRLGVPNTQQPYFLQAYFQQKPVRRILRFWYRLNKECFSHYIEWKQKLGLKKLAEKLRLQ